jgi:hypothetical protein
LVPEAESPLDLIRPSKGFELLSQRLGGRGPNGTEGALEAVGGALQLVAIAVLNGRV